MSATWTKKRLKFIAPSARQILSAKPEGVRYIGLENIESSTGRLLLDNEQEQVDSSVIAFDERSVLFGKLRPYLAKVATPDFAGVASTEIMVFRPAAENDKRFLAYSFLSDEFIKRVSGLADGAKMPRANPDEVRNLELSITSLPEQRRIAGYLDEETGKLDRLLGLRRRQMELLREQRAALIQQAVTRGLDPSAPLKDSALPWLGQIPKHWKLIPVKYAARISRGKFGHRPRSDPAFYDGQYPFVQTGDVATAAKYITTFSQTLNEKGYSVSTEFAAGTLLMAIAANIGDLAILGFNACAPDSVVGLLPYNGVEAEFLYYELSCIQSWLYALAPENTQMNLNVDRFAPLKIAIPPQDEQKAICRYIIKTEKQTDQLHAAYTRQLELLTEYRASLIHECVTGQRPVPEVSNVKTERAANVHFLRSVLGAEIIHRLHLAPRFGRVKLEKILFLSEAYAGIHLEGHYQRAAAGPFDNRALRSLETQIQRQKWYQPVKGDKGTRYLPLEKAGGHQLYFEKYWTAQRARFEHIIHLLRPLKTENCEMIATLFAVWQDRLAANEPFDDASLVEEVWTNWHPSKQRINRDRWLAALDWMRKYELVPVPLL